MGSHSHVKFSKYSPLRHAPLHSRTGFPYSVYTNCNMHGQSVLAAAVICRTIFNAHFLVTVSV